MKKFCSGGGGGVSIPEAVSSTLRPAALNSMNTINLLHPLWIKRHTFVYLLIPENFRSFSFWVLEKLQLLPFVLLLNVKVEQRSQEMREDRVFSSR